MKSHRLKVVARRLFIEEENRRLKIVVQICEVPWIIGSERKCRVFNPQAGEVFLVIAHRQIGVSERKDRMYVGSAKRDPPI